MATVQPLDIIKKALGDIGAYAPGDFIEPALTNDAFDTLNDMLDAASNEHEMLYAQQEVIHELNGNSQTFTIGPGGQVGCSFTGSISGNTLTVTALISGALSVWQLIAGTGVPVNCTISAYGTGTGGNTNSALGTYSVNQAPVSPIGPIAMTSTAPRPLRINSAFVRISTATTGLLDYQVAVLAAQEWARIQIKSLPGPWPVALYYQPTEPVGILNYYPFPASCEMHLFCDMLLSKFNNLTDTIMLPEGFKMWMRWNLAELLMPSYGKTDQMQAQMVMANAKRFRAQIKRTNMQPMPGAVFDPMICGRQAQNRPGWFLDGGFGWY
jgi:hypothetical protein